MNYLIHSSVLKKLKKNKIAGKYIGSGLFKTMAHAVSGIIVLRWLDPISVGEWQSFTVFVGYLQILTLGVNSGLNRELPYWIGKGEVEIGMARLQTAGYFITTLSLALMSVVSITSIILFIFNVFSVNQMIMMIFAFSTGALTIQTNFLGATFRSDQSFDRLSKIQFLNSFLYIALIPLVYFFELWGYITYQIILAVALYLGYKILRPYKVDYFFSLTQFKELVRVGFPMYFWNYISSMSRSIPRLILVIWGSPLLVGLFAPAAAFNGAFFEFTKLLEQVFVPSNVYKFGQNRDKQEIYKYVTKAAKYLFLFMLVGALIFSLTIPFVFPVFFPYYTEGVFAAQIVVFSGVFFSINSLFHNALNSVKELGVFKYIVVLQVLGIIMLSYLIFWGVGDLLLSVAIASLLSEMVNTFGYYYSFRNIVLKNG